MKCLVITNTASEIITMVDVFNLHTKNISIEHTQNKIGPSGLDVYGNKIVVANSYDNSISTINIDHEMEEKRCYVGAFPVDVKVLNDLSLVALSESNSLVGVNMRENKIEFNITLEDFPYSIALDKINNLAYVSNMNSNSISIVDISEKTIMTNIKTGLLPSKLIYSSKQELLYSCESHLGTEESGSVICISPKNKEIIKRIKVGKGPLDLIEHNEFLYVSNFEEGSISIINKEKFQEIKRIYIGGMPKGIASYEDKIYVADYYGGALKVIDLMKKEIKTITVGQEPNAMIFINNSN